MPEGVRGGGTSVVLVGALTSVVGGDHSPSPARSGVVTVTPSVVCTLVNIADEDHSFSPIRNGVLGSVLIAGLVPDSVWLGWLSQADGFKGVSLAIPVDTNEGAYVLAVTVVAVVVVVAAAAGSLPDVSA